MPRTAAGLDSVKKSRPASTSAGSTLLQKRKHCQFHQLLRNRQSWVETVSDVNSVSCPPSVIENPHIFPVGTHQRVRTSECRR